MKITHKQKSDNPFYGNTAMYAMFQELSKNNTVRVDPLLDKAYTSITNTMESELFYSIFFSIGDITDRKHNIFEKDNIDSGGQSKRKMFRDMLSWLLKKQPEHFYKLLPLIIEYTNIENIFYYQLRTKKGSSKIESVEKLNIDTQKVGEFIASCLLDKSLSKREELTWMKFLSNIRTSKRVKVDKDGKKVGARPLQKETLNRNAFRTELLEVISTELNWEIKKHKHNTEFVGFKKWKAKYNDDLLSYSEAKLFSSNNIVKLDKDQFFAWLNTLPSGARYRVRRRLLDGDNTPSKKWKSRFGDNFGKLFLEWEAYKEAKQYELRKAMNDIANGKIIDKDTMRKLSKEAKVTTGGNDMFKLFHDFVSGNIARSEFDTIADSILNKIKFEVPVLVCVDVSGSMSGMPLNVAKFLTTTALLKNPDSDGSKFFIRFATSSDVVSDNGYGIDKANRFMTGKEIRVDKLVDKTKNFRWNYDNIEKYITCNGSTNFDSVSKGLFDWTKQDQSQESMRVEMIKKYPVFLVVSDGDMNNDRNAGASMAKFQQDMRQWFGWEGVVVVWDVTTRPECESKFNGLENVIHFFGFNASIINQIFSNIHDLEIIDVYTPLNSLHKSNRYEPVREIVRTFL